MDLGDRLEELRPDICYITLKDHKDGFRNNTKCRLINACKLEIGRSAKVILQEANSKIRNKLKLMQPMLRL